MSKKKIEFVTYRNEDAYNTVPFGLDAPVSRQGKSRLNFQLHRLMGGRVFSMDQLCPNQILETFALPTDLSDKLFGTADTVDTAAEPDQS